MQRVVDEIAPLFPNVTKKQLKEIITAGVDTIVTIANRDGRVACKSNIFKKTERAPRKGRNPQTGETINIPAKTVVTYHKTHKSAQ
jgi:nucleoid DNA-binding protein